MFEAVHQRKGPLRGQAHCFLVLLRVFKQHTRSYGCDGLLPLSLLVPGLRAQPHHP